MTKIIGTPDNETLRGSEEVDHIWGLSGNDNIDAGGGDDFVNAGAGHDVLTSSSGYDRLDGGAGDDRIILIGTGGAITGGFGYDTLIVDLSTLSDRVVFNGGSGHAVIGYGSTDERHLFFRDIEALELRTGSGDDRITGTARGDRIFTGAGNDVVDAGAGNDFIENIGGYDRINAGSGDDRISLVCAGGAVFGGAGSDTLSIDLRSGSEPVVFNGENGHGIIGYQTSEQRHLFFEYHDIELIGLSTGSGNDHVRGTAFADYILTQAGDDYVDGGAGNDTIVDGLGANHLFGGDGNDLINTTFASAEIDGGQGWDSLRIYEQTRLTGITIDFAAGSASTGTVLRGIEEAVIVLGAGNDTVIATNLAYVTVQAGAGDDHIEGGAGNDALYGEAGNDTLVGGNGVDILIGGSGADMFLWSTESRDQGGIDRIRDFGTASGDVIAFSDVAQASTGIHDYASFLAASTDTASGVYVAFNGSSTFGFLIEGVSLAALTAEDLVFGI
ncbi:calcium-binding protein [Rhizobium sp. ARZ01]|uniref:calcium-binding protein n=1 Tax=Rhizobium sp. ARZ01 TaxID=2769313 RepID=UPI00177C8E9B|nr:calcium-binding protein [Rhizobium sp. ARZ01]MBD9371762.1 calcium-binding protein [Rhizobium sp. ARZ01]